MTPHENNFEGKAVMYFLDTNICIYFISGKYPSIVEELRSRKPSDIKIPSMVKAELLYGVEKSVQKEKNYEYLHKFLEPFEIVNFDDTASQSYANIRSDLEKKVTIFGPNDLVIAATVLSRHGTLVSHNTKEFSHVEGHLLTDWVH